MKTKIRNKIFISGPMTGYENYNRKEFEIAYKELDQRGWDVYSPLFNGVQENRPYWRHMKEDLKMLLKCDFIFHLQGWEKSKGSMVEHITAMNTGIVGIYLKHSETISTLTQYPQAQQFSEYDYKILRKLQNRARPEVSIYPKFKYATETKSDVNDDSSITNTEQVNDVNEGKGKGPGTDRGLWKHWSNHYNCYERLEMNGARDQKQIKRLARSPVPDILIKYSC